MEVGYIYLGTYTSKYFQRLSVEQKLVAVKFQKQIENIWEYRIAFVEILFLKLSSFIVSFLQN